MFRPLFLFLFFLLPVALIVLPAVVVVEASSSFDDAVNTRLHDLRKRNQALKDSLRRKLEETSTKLDVEDAFIVALNNAHEDESLITSERLKKKTKGKELEFITDHEGQTFACVLPSSSPSSLKKKKKGEEGEKENGGGDNKREEGDAEEEEKEEEEEEEPNAPSIASLLQPLTNACFYRFEGWWTYEFCFKKHVRQYHVESNAKVSVDYSLGKFNEALTNKTRDDENETEIKKREASVGIPATAFHVHHFTDGTECDIGSLETRKTEVHFVCAEDGQNTVLSVKEPTTCSYNLQFATPLLCSHEAFVTKEKNIEPIRCYAYKNEKEDERTFQEILLDAGNYDEEDINSKNSERENSDGHGKNDEL